MMKVGLWLTARHEPERSLQTHFALLRAQVGLARAGGFEILSSGQHFLSPRLQTFPLLAALASEAGSMKMATSILLLPLHNPVQVAEDAATMQAISPGGFVLGVGLGHDAGERAAFGVAPGTAVSRFVESIEVMRRIWAGDGRAHDSASFTVPQRDDARALPTPGLWVGGNSAGARRRAVAATAAWFPSGIDVQPLASGHSEVDESLRSRGHASPDRPVGLWTHIASTDESARNLARRVGHLHADQVARPGFVVGSPERCIETLHAYQEQARATHALLRLEVPGMGQDEVLRQIDLLATTVLPALRRA